MKTEVVQVTPELARKWLKLNSLNRPLRPSHIETLRISFERGEYVMTHQGIAFVDDGELLDGQHRLSAIAQLQSGTFPMLVTRGLERQLAFPVVDATQAKRNTSDVLSVERGLGEVGNFFARLHQGRTVGLTPSFVAPFVEFASGPYHELTAFCGSVTRTWSSAPVRSAAVICMKQGDKDYTMLVYRSLVLADFDSMPKIAQTMFRAHMNGSVRAAAAHDIFCRCLKVFSASKANLSKVQINDISLVTQSVREMLNTEIFGAPTKKAPTVSRGAKGVYESNFRIEGL